MGPSHAGAPTDTRAVKRAAVATAQAGPTDAQIAAARARLVTLNRQLRALTPYVRVADGRQVLLVDRARAARAPGSLIELARQLVAYQNALLRRARQQFVNGSLPSVALTDYPLVRSLFTAASVAAIRQLRAGHAGPTPRNALDLTVPCGDWANPLPAANPPRALKGPYSDVRDVLRRSGFHPTAGYACGRSELKICRGDYTRGHRFTSRAGVCAPPRFRDQANPSGTRRGYVYVQYGEPNPELASYSWPAWTWGAYVVWWHRNY
jgi:hypothetical protein